MRMKIPRKIVLMGFIGLLALTGVKAIAQWHWVDDQGRKVFSDRPPGPVIPDKNILKRPVQAPKASVSAPVDSNANVEAGKLVPPKSGASSTVVPRDKNATDQTQKLKQEQDRLAASKVQNCALAKRQLAGLNAGGRIARFNEKGEREFLDDAAKSAEMRLAQKTIESDCK